MVNISKSKRAQGEINTKRFRFNPNHNIHKFNPGSKRVNLNITLIVTENVIFDGENVIFDGEQVVA